MASVPIKMAENDPDSRPELLYGDLNGFFFFAGEVISLWFHTSQH